MKKRGRKVFLEWMKNCVEDFHEGDADNFSHLHIDFMDKALSKKINCG